MLPTGGMSEEHSVNIYKAKPFLKNTIKHSGRVNLSDVKCLFYRVTQ